MSKSYITGHYTIRVRRHLFIFAIIIFDKIGDVMGFLSNYDFCFLTRKALSLYLSCFCITVLNICTYIHTYSALLIYALHYVVVSPLYLSQNLVQLKLKLAAALKVIRTEKRCQKALIKKNKENLSPHL